MTNLTVTQRVKNLENRFEAIERKIDLLLASKQQPKSANRSNASKSSPAPAKTSKKSNTQLSSTKKGKGKKATVSFEERMKAWNEKREEYKPSTKLIDAIKRDRASITHKVAKTKYGFIGTKKDLAWIKEGVERNEY